MRIVLTLSAMLITCGCGTSSPFYQCPHPEFSDGDYQRAALDLVGNWNYTSRTQQDVDRIRMKADALRPWAAKISDACMRDHVEDWLDFFVRQARDSFADQGKSSDEKYEQDRMQENMRKRALLRLVPVPALPVTNP